LGASARTAKGASATRTTQEEVVEEASLLKTVKDLNATKTMLDLVVDVEVERGMTQQEMEAVALGTIAVVAEVENGTKIVGRRTSRIKALGKRLILSQRDMYKVAPSQILILGNMRNRNRNLPWSHKRSHRLIQGQVTQTDLTYDQGCGSN